MHSHPFCLQKEFQICSHRASGNKYPRSAALRKDLTPKGGGGFGDWPKQQMVSPDLAGWPRPRAHGSALSTVSQ